MSADPDAALDAPAAAPGNVLEMRRLRGDHMQLLEIRRLRGVHRQLLESNQGSAIGIAGAVWTEHFSDMMAPSTVAQEVRCTGRKPTVAHH